MITTTGVVLVAGFRPLAIHHRDSGLRRLRLFCGWSAVFPDIVPSLSAS